MTTSFHCDAMLGTLSRFLRAMGFDASYADSEAADDNVLAFAAGEGRTLLTRDVQLAARARGQQVEAVLLGNLPVEHQATIALTHLGLSPEPDRFFTRCIVCNTTLRPATSVEVQAAPPAVRQRHRDFTHCPTCERLYWPGTHVEGLEARLKQILDAVAGTDDSGNV